MATGEPSVRPWRTPPTSVSSSTSKRWRGPAAVAEAAAGQLGLDVLDGDGQAGGQALDDDHERLAVRLAGGEVAQHRRTGYWRAASSRPPEAARLGRSARMVAAARSSASGGRAHRRRVGAATGPQLLLEHGLVDEHPEPVDGRAARRPRRPAAAPSRAGGTRGRRRPGPARSSAGSNGSSSVPMPDRRGVDDDVGAGRRRRPRRPGPTGDERRRPRPRATRVRLTTATSAAPARPSASTTLRAAAPAPTTATAAPATSTPAAASEATKPSPSVLCPTRRPSASARRPCSPSAARPPPGASSSTAAATSSLCGVVTDSPPRPSVRIGVERRAGARRAATSNATYTQSSPAAANAALCIAGDSEWCDGRADHRGDAHGGAGQSRRPAARGPVDVGLVLLGRDGEGVAAVLVGEHVVEVLARRALGQAGAQRVADARVRRRVERGLDRRPARVGDRRRRQARC